MGRGMGDVFLTTFNCLILEEMPFSMMTDEKGVKR
ncbi:hypothetical protein VR7878_02148 [Vibrio ruber DSM 16370]|uniref:Uncharacterized protein n=1 Tax=Vibrio ruber (strain DSM 16370 / JCM 11486 / BCRC 17186 / CECT 7878 / LMG 23124 / VR1) TaxID=1123498 RepID=A0A1R4LL61_VIBR1|nr:hypothetical protein VR7878_02148 [Vibrio ruber DSM 16370]